MILQAGQRLEASGKLWTHIFRCGKPIFMRVFTQSFIILNRRYVIDGKERL